MANVKFTTKSMIVDGVRHRVAYTLRADEYLEVSGEIDGKAFQIAIAPNSKYYASARAAYDEKAAKRAKYEAERPETPEKLFVGTELKGPGYTICMDGSIGKATVTFKRKPSVEVRALVKAAGFYWSPVHKQWSRGLTNKAWRAAQELHKQLWTA